MMAVLLLISIAISFISCGIYVKKARELKDLKQIYESLHRGGGLDNVIKVLSEEISDMGVTVIAFFKKNRGTLQIESEKDSLPILQHSSAVKALFAHTPQHADAQTTKWKLLEDAEEMFMSMERKAILELLHQSPDRLSPKEIARRLQRREGNIQFLLGKLLKDCKIKKVARGRYIYITHNAKDTQNDNIAQDAKNDKESEELADLL